MWELEPALIYPLLLAGGALIGLAASFTGLGGGFLMVPLLLAAGMPVTGSVGTSFVAILVISVSALVAHGKLRHVDRGLGLVLGVGGALGAQAGARLLPHLPERAFRLIFALVLVGLAVRVARHRRDTADAAVERAGARARSLAGWLGLLGLGGAVGLAASLTGLGGGFVVVPVALLLGLSAAKAVGTSFLAILVISVSAATAHAQLAHVDFAVGVTLGLGGIAGAQLGARLVARVSQRAFRRIFAALLLGLALQVLVG